MQLPWKFDVLESESLTDVVSGMRHRNQAARRKQRWAGCPVKLLSFRAKPLGIRRSDGELEFRNYEGVYPQGHAKQGQVGLTNCVTCHL